MSYHDTQNALDKAKVIADFIAKHHADDVPGALKRARDLAQSNEARHAVQLLEKVLILRGLLK